MNHGGVHQNGSFWSPMQLWMIFLFHHEAINLVNGKLETAIMFSGSKKDTYRGEATYFCKQCYHL